VQEAYRLLCIVSPEVAQFEKAITTLQVRHAHGGV